MYPALLSILFLLGSCLCKGQDTNTVKNWQQPLSHTIFLKIGDRAIPFTLAVYGNLKDLVFINLHDDEQTSVIATKRLLQQQGGLLIRLDNRGDRIIRFNLNGKRYGFDPNRIFSREGINKTLTEQGRFSKKAADEVDKFAKRILQLIPKNLSWLIALHNNKDEGYSINDYLPGNEKEKDAKDLHINPDKDADDLFLTTDSNLFDSLAAENYNILLQDNINAEKDGSLSIYCGEKNIRYLNCETEHDKIAEYEKMITIAESYMRKKQSATTTN